MKITAIDTIQMRLPNSSWMVLRVKTDDGLVGWGDISGSCDDDPTAGIVDAVMKPALMGQNPLHMMGCMQSMNRWTYPKMLEVRPFAVARSGLDQALWDLTARYYQVPLYKLYGADGVSEVPLYANLNNAIRNDRSIQALHDQCVNAKKAGFEIVKCTPFDEIDPTKAAVDYQKSFERLAAVMDVWDISHVAIDCHQRFNRWTLGTVADHVLTNYGNPFWLEDPVPVLEYDLIRNLSVRFPKIRWAAGEDSLEAASLMRTVASDCYDVIMPDVRMIGGPSVIRGLVQAVDSMGKKLTLHNPAGIISTAHSAHLTALCGGLPLEFPFGAVAQRELFSVPAEPVCQGKYVFTDEPGIGLELREEAICEYGSFYQNGRWIKCGNCDGRNTL